MSLALMGASSTSSWSMVCMVVLVVAVLLLVCRTAESALAQHRASPLMQRMQRVGDDEMRRRMHRAADVRKTSQRMGPARRAHDEEVCLSLVFLVLSRLSSVPFFLSCSDFSPLICGVKPSLSFPSFFLPLPFLRS